MNHLYAFLVARVRDRQLAEDLTQQVYLKAMRGLDGFRGDDAVMVSWLFQIARNESANLIRRQARETSWDALGPAAPEPVDEHGSPEAAALRSEQERELGDMVRRLTPDQQELLDLRYGAGLSLVQIAAMFGISDVAARQRLRRTLAQLRREIHDATTG